MKKIINGKRYDTDTATLVGSWANEYPVNDFHFESEDLYRKRNGEFFLFGEGNAMSRYATPSGNNVWEGGSRITPLTYDGARQWAEDHLSADEYESIFGEVSEDGDEGTVTLSVRVTPAAKAALDRMAAKTGRSKSELVSEALLGLV